MSDSIAKHPYQNLIELDEFSFPHRCSCSKHYADLGQFLSETTPASNGTGLNELHWQNERRVGVWRNCTCGNTMLVLCANRRDTSHQGRANRDHFGRQLKVLQRLGLSLNEARARLLQSSTDTAED